MLQRVSKYMLGCVQFGMSVSLTASVQAYPDQLVKFRSA
jgi:hypothetical protein